MAQTEQQFYCENATNDTHETLLGTVIGADKQEWFVSRGDNGMYFIDSANSDSCVELTPEGVDKLVKLLLLK